MYLEIYESVGKVGEVRFEPYEYEYYGTLDDVESYLEKGEPRFPAVGEAPEVGGAPTTVERTSIKGRLHGVAGALLARGAWDCKIKED